MNLVIFILTYPIIWVLSILPMRVLYFFSDILFVFVYYIVGYRKYVVYNNLKLSYPEKSDEELHQLTKKTIAHFCDFIYETIKTFNISKKEISKRFVTENIEVINELEKKGKGIIFLGTHYANWEWMANFVYTETNLYPITAYAPITNKYFSKVILSSRLKTTNLVRKDETVKVIEDLIKKDVKIACGLLSDQSPSLHKTRYWSEFLGQFVPVINGAEFIAKKNNLAVVNLLVTRVKRGYYSLRFELLAENPNNFAENEITDMYLKSSTEHISKAPEFYLWTHKRFKHLGKYDEWMKMKNK